MLLNGNLIKFLFKHMTKIKILTALFFIFFGISARIFMVEFIKIPNFEIVTALSLVVGAMLGGIFTLIVPLSIIAISDIYIGNMSILFFTWSAFVIIGIFGWLLRERKFFSYCFVVKMTGLGVFSSIFFYLYTNFGWWFLTNIYPKNLEGLIQCYVMGLPFLRINLLGNLFFVPVFTLLTLSVYKLYSVLECKLSNKLKKTIYF